MKFLRRCFTTTARVIENGVGIEIKYAEIQKRVHALWLRERTQNKMLKHASGQRLFEVADYVDKKEAIVKNVKINGKMLELNYADEFKDIIPLKYVQSELEDNFMLPTSTLNIENVEVEEPLMLRSKTKKFWGEGLGMDSSVDLLDLTYDYHEVVNKDEIMFNFLESLQEWGVAVVSNTPGDLEMYKKFLKTFGFIRETNWGEWFEVVAKPKAQSEDDSSVSDLAYSSEAIPLHTDGPYNVNPLRYQLLQCLKQSKIGGESILSDGVAAARALQLNNQQRFDILTKTPISFRYYDETCDLLTERTLISLERGKINEIFFSGRLDITPSLPTLEETNEYFKAKAAFIKELYKEDHIINFKLNVGDMVIFSNTRILHGRSAFKESSETTSNDGDNNTNDKSIKNNQQQQLVGGPDLNSYSRYLRGCYMEGISSKYRVYKRRVTHRASAGPSFSGPL